VIRDVGENLSEERKIFLKKFSFEESINVSEEEIEISKVLSLIIRI